MGLKGPLRNTESQVNASHALSKRLFFSCHFNHVVFLQLEWRLFWQLLHHPRCSDKHVPLCKRGRRWAKCRIRRFTLLLVTASSHRSMWKYNAAIVTEARGLCLHRPAHWFWISTAVMAPLSRRVLYDYDVEDRMRRSSGWHLVPAPANPFIRVFPKDF